MTPGGNNLNYFLETQLTKFSAKLLVSDSREHTKCLPTHRAGMGRRGRLQVAPLCLDSFATDQ